MAALVRSLLVASPPLVRHRLTAHSRPQSEPQLAELREIFSVFDKGATRAPQGLLWAG